MQHHEEIPEKIRATVKRAQRSGMDKEADVKRVTRRCLAHFDTQFHFMPPANAYGKAGISDILCVIEGRPVAIETKFGSNKPTVNQKNFGKAWADAGGLFLVVTDRNIVDMMMRIYTFIYECDSHVELYNEH